jgi:hypothetical protein
LNSTIQLLVIVNDQLKCPRMQKAFLRCTATEMRWRKHMVKRGSWVTAAIWRSMSFTRLIVCLPQTPDISMTNEMKSTPAIMSLYFHAFLSSDTDAVNPAYMLLECTWDWAYVSGQVVLHAGTDLSPTAPVLRYSVWSFPIVRALRKLCMQIGWQIGRKTA